MIQNRCIPHLGKTMAIKSTRVKRITRLEKKKEGVDELSADDKAISPPVKARRFKTSVVI